MTTATAEPRKPLVGGMSEQVQRKLPDPKGYQILIALPEPEEKTEGGIIKPEQAKHTETVTSMVGYVLDMGEDCYKDETRFPSGPYCKTGDFVLFHAYSGSRFAVFGKEFRLITDDAVRAVVDDPRGITRVG